MGRLFLVNEWMERFGFGRRFGVADCQGFIVVGREFKVEVRVAGTIQF
jgi:hypothetical protein